MKIDVLTLFPEMFTGPMDASIIQRARRTGLLDLRVHNLRDYTHDNYKTVDDRPFGGGPGMVLKCEPVAGRMPATAAGLDRQMPAVPQSGDGILDGGFRQADRVADGLLRWPRSTAVAVDVLRDLKCDLEGARRQLHVRFHLVEPVEELARMSLGVGHGLAPLAVPRSCLASASSRAAVMHSTTSLPGLLAGRGRAWHWPRCHRKKSRC